MKKLRTETPEEVRKWFLAEVEKIWPISGGSLSLRKNRCIRLNCQACSSGEGHPAYALHYRLQGRQSSIYVPDDLAKDIEQAVQHGWILQELMLKAGLRYVNALKLKRRAKLLKD